MECSIGYEASSLAYKKLESDIEFDSDKQMDEFVGLLIDAHNNTRMKENRGHKPNELRSSAVRAGKKNYPNDLQE